MSFPRGARTANNNRNNNRYGGGNSGSNSPTNRSSSNRSNDFNVRNNNNKKGGDNDVNKSEIMATIAELTRRMDEMRMNQQQQYQQQQHSIYAVGGPAGAGGFNANVLSPSQELGALHPQPSSMHSPAPNLHFLEGNAQLGVDAQAAMSRANSYNRLAIQQAATNASEENQRVNNLLENEAKERRKAELKILELSSQLEDARRGLRETQNALMDVQHAAEVLTQKRDERNAQFQKILMENKTLEAKIFEQDMEIRNMEKLMKANSAAADDRASKLQDELNTNLEASHRVQAENTRNKTEKARLEAEVENANRKIKSMETAHRHAELAYREEHEAEVNKYEDRLRQAMSAADDGRKNDIKLLDTKTELYNKINELKALEIKLLETDSVKRQMEQKTTQLELNVHNFESQIRQKDVRINQLEQEALSTQSELNLLKNTVGKKDEEINTFIQESFEIGARFDQIKKNNKDLERKLASINVDDYNDQISKLRHEIEKKDVNLKQAARNEEELNRQLKTLKEDHGDLEERVKNHLMQLSTTNATLSETQQSLKVCEQALNDIKAEKVSLQWKLNVEEKRATRLEETLRRAALTKGVSLPNQTPKSSAVATGGGSGQSTMFPSPGAGYNDSMNNSRSKVSFNQDETGNSIKNNSMSRNNNNQGSPKIDQSPKGRQGQPGQGGPKNMWNQKKDVLKPKSILNMKQNAAVPPSPTVPVQEKSSGGMLGGLNFMRRK